MRKFEEFFHVVLETARSLNNKKDVVKEVLGDSTNNHRTLTVNQVVRYVSSGGIRTPQTARKLRRVYSILKPYIKEDRAKSTSRTDAIDINELVSTYRAIVMNDRKLRKNIGIALGKVG